MGNHGAFPDALKAWRKQRKLSQLDLALVADVSQRHLSWLETGRSQPSREMVLRLSEAMSVPLRERNSLLNSAGYANMFSEHQLDEPAMDSVRSILEEMLQHHEPYPAYVLDRHWNIVMQNQACDILFDVIGDADEIWNSVCNTSVNPGLDNSNKQRNAALLFVHPAGLRRYVRNWDSIIGPFSRRLRQEAIESQDPASLAMVEQISEYIGDIELVEQDFLLPTLPIELGFGDLVLKLTTVISTFGTAVDITADELRLETFYPVDEATARYFKD